VKAGTERVQKPEQEPQVVALRTQGLSYAKIGKAMGLSPSRVQRILQRHFRRQWRLCLGCRPEPLEIDMMGMTVTMRWVEMSDPWTAHEYGDAPIEPAYIEMMKGVARALDETFNEGVKGPARKVGFVLLVFPFGEAEGRCNYISNGADRRDVVTMLKEQVKRFEGQADQSGRA
jgi:hypothetical protein